MTGADRARRVVDLSHTIRAGLVTYPGMPGPEITDYLTRADAERSYGPGVTFHIGRVSMVANTGTYIDSPFHRYAEGADLAGLVLSQLVDVPGVCVHLEPQDPAERLRAVDVDDLERFDVTGKAVLVHTGWDRHWDTPAYGVDGPFLTAAATAWLVEHGAWLVGIDSVNIDDTHDMTRPAHSGLLAAGVPIVEHLRGLEQLPETGFRFHAAPPPIEQFGTFTVRAYAIVD